jgi:hypothetical protein
MTDEEIVEAMAKALANFNFGSDAPWERLSQTEREANESSIFSWKEEYRAQARAALSIAKPLIAREARETALKEAAAAAARWYNDDPPSDGMIDGTCDGLQNAILALSDNAASGQKEPLVGKAQVHKR